jgi:hypothetical protein
MEGRIGADCNSTVPLDRWFTLAASDPVSLRPRYAHATAYDAASDVLWLFGGMEFGQSFADLSRFHFQARPRVFSVFLLFLGFPCCVLCCSFQPLTFPLFSPSVHRQ